MSAAGAVVRRSLARAVLLAVLPAVLLADMWPAAARAQAVPMPAAPAPAPVPAHGGVKGAIVRAMAARGRSEAEDRFDDAFRKNAKRWFGVAYDWRVFKAQGMAESNLNPRAKSWVGARGIMQLMPATYREIRAGQHDLGEITDPEYNIAAGIAHDRYLYRLFPDSMPEAERRRFMFAAYNAGQGTIARARAVAQAERLDPATWSSVAAVAPRVPRWRYRETLGYVERIEQNHARLLAAPADATAAKGAVAALLARKVGGLRPAAPASISPR